MRYSCSFAVGIFKIQPCIRAYAKDQLAEILREIHVHVIVGAHGGCAVTLSFETPIQYRYS